MYICTLSDAIMNYRLFLDKIRLALLKRSGKAQKKGGRNYEAWRAKGHIKQPMVSFIVQSHNKSLQVCHFLPELRKYADSEIIVIDDGSSPEHAQRIVEALTGANEFMVRANDLYENIMYDKCLRFANGRFVALLQDDDDIRGTEWIERALGHFTRHQDMVILGGFGASNLTFCTEDDGSRNFRAKDARQGDFSFAMTVNRAPMWINRELYMQHLRHIDYNLAPFQNDDYELCLRAWTCGLKVGWYRVDFPSLSVGGMRLYNDKFIAEMMRRNAPQIYDRYISKEESIRHAVEEANSSLY